VNGLPGWAEGLADRLLRKVPLSERTHIKIGGPAEWLVEPRTAAEAAALLKRLHDAGVAVRILGGGNNLLAPDGGVLDAVVVSPARIDHCVFEGTKLRAGGGLSLTKAITEANAAGLAGMHPLGGIPAQIGGAVAMNAGGRHGWISDVLESATVALPDGRCLVIPAADLEFGYRHCRLPEGALVVEAVFALKPGDAAELKRTCAEIVKTKNAAQPTRGANFGCTWKNPGGQEGMSRAEMVARLGARGLDPAVEGRLGAGQLVDLSGAKGTRIGGAEITAKHGNFIDNLGGATAADVRALIETGERAVEERFGITLEREVVVWPEPALSDEGSGG